MFTLVQNKERVLLHVHILVVNLFVNGVSAVLWVSFSDMCITDTSFVFIFFLHIVFFSPGSRSQPFGKPKGNLDPLLSVEKDALS